MELTQRSLQLQRKGLTGFTVTVNSQSGHKVRIPKEMAKLSFNRQSSFWILTKETIFLKDLGSAFYKFKKCRRIRGTCLSKVRQSCNSRWERCIHPTPWQSRGVAVNHRSWDCWPVGYSHYFALGFKNIGLGTYCTGIMERSEFWESTEVFPCAVCVPSLHNSNDRRDSDALFKGFWNLQVYFLFLTNMLDDSDMYPDITPRSCYCNLSDVRGSAT